MEKITATPFAMNKEPIPNATPADVRSWYNSHHDEEGLAAAFAVTSNKLWWVEDNIYDYEKGTPEYKEACDITDAWGNLMDELKEGNLHYTKVGECQGSKNRSGCCSNSVYATEWL